jgi:hypothetical protein
MRGERTPHWCDGLTDSQFQCNGPRNFNQSSPMATFSAAC